MAKHRFYTTVLIMSIILLPLLSTAEEVSHPTLNIPYLCTFGQLSGSDWGDDDFSQTIFFTVPESFTDIIYVRIFDPDIGIKVDEIQGRWDTKTRFQLYGGPGSFTNPDAKGLDPKGEYKSGNLIAEKAYGFNRNFDKKWVVLAEVQPNQGELHKGFYFFKLIVEGIEGDDGNLYKVDFSTSPDHSVETTDIEVFAYEWSFRLPNEVGTMIYTFPFIVPKEAKSVISRIWDFDNDNKIYLNTPTRPGLPVYATGNKEWSITRYNFGVDMASIQSPGGKHWSSTSYDILDEDYEKPWCFQINKGTFRNNDTVVYATDSEGNPFPMYSTAQPRSGLVMAMGGKVYKPEFITTDDILFISRDTVVYADITLAPGTVLPKGTIIAKGTLIPQKITVKGGRVIPAGTVLEEDVVLAKPIVLQDKMILKKGSLLKKGTQIAKGSILYEGLAPGTAVLPPCNTVFLDASGSTDPDGNPLSFTWDMGDGTTAEGIRVIHTYRESGSYVVSVVARDNSGAINDAASKAITITINTPPIAKAGSKKWACSGDTVRFDGTKSYDPDGFVTNQKWFFGDGTSSDGDTAVHVYDEPGVYSVRLDVTDNSQSVCSADSDGVVVIVNEPPVAKAGMDIVGCDYTIHFNGTKSYDPDGKVTKYLWYFGDGSVGEGPTPEHTYSDPGLYNVKLVVFDDSESRCNTSSDEMKVLINVTPVAEAGPDRRVCKEYKVFFNGAASYDPNGDALSYRWDFGDGTPESTEMSPVHTYEKAGKYTVRLTLMDSSNTACSISTDTAIVSVDTNPVADAGPDQLVDIGQNVTLDASSSMDPNGYPLTYNWTFGDLSDPAEGVSVTHVYGKPGIYRALVTVTSTANHGCNTNYDELRITVNNPPVARAGTSIVTHAGAEIILNGESSFDPDGSITSYKWNFGDKTTPVTSSKPKATHSYSEPGLYTATLTVRDNTELPGGVGSDTVDIIVNFPPTADAGKSRTVCIGQVFFDGTGSRDTDGNIISYEWDFGDGKKGNGGRPVHIYRSPGVYKVTLTVTDNSGTATSKASATTSIEINGPPLVDIGEQKQLTCPEVSTLLDASASTDPNEDKINYEWDFGDGEKATGSSVKHVYKSAGRFIASVTASDGRNMKCSQNTASKIVIVNDLPIADAGPNQLVNPHDSVSFKGTGSVDPDGKITEYAWNMGDGAANEGMTVKHAYAKPGKYTVKLTVKDDSATVCDKDTDEMTVTVNSPPIADAGPDMVNLCSGTVQFDGTASKDPDGTITFYEWDFGDGSPNGMGPKPKHTYAKPGTYNVILKVVDDSNLRSSISNDAMKVVINYPPVAKIEAPKVVCPNEAVKMSAKDSYDTDGSIIEYEWNFGDGSPKIQGRNITHIYKKPGKYDVVLTVIDNSDSSCDIGTANHTVTVNSPPVAKAGDDVITCVQTTDCSVVFDASNSRDEDNDHLTYHWDFGDGNKKEGIRVRYEYENPGVYTVTLTVTDESGTSCGRDTATMKITANAPPDVELKKGD